MGIAADNVFAAAHYVNVHLDSAQASRFRPAGFIEITILSDSYTDSVSHENMVLLLESSVQQYVKQTLVKSAGI